MSLNRKHACSTLAVAAALTCPIPATAKEGPARLAAFKDVPVIIYPCPAGKPDPSERGEVGVPPPAPPALISPPKSPPRARTPTPAPPPSPSIPDRYHEGRVQFRAVATVADSTRKAFQILGCVRNPVGLVHETAGNKRSVVAANGRGDVYGKLVRFETFGERDTAIRNWLGGQSSGGFQDGGNNQIGEFMFHYFSGSDGSFSIAIFPKGAERGEMCLVAVGPRAPESYLTTLNNWCADELGVWAGS